MGHGLPALGFSIILIKGTITHGPQFALPRRRLCVRVVALLLSPGTHLSNTDPWWPVFVLCPSLNAFIKLPPFVHIITQEGQVPLLVPIFRLEN